MEAGTMYSERSVGSGTTTGYVTFPVSENRERRRNVNTVKIEIGQLEKALNALVRRPWLLRRDYWISQVECLLGRPGLSAQDRQRLCTLLDLLGTPVAECSVSLQQ
jgi:hypothetical protein